VLKKQVICRNCGFLATTGLQTYSPEKFKLWKELGLAGEVEVEKIGRDMIANSTFGTPELLTCVKRVWASLDMRQKSIDEIFNNLNVNRRCLYFFSYHPGYSPSEHRELQREAKTHRLLTRNMLLAATIGAGAAILAQHLAR
jgi:hypothetical protein